MRPLPTPVHAWLGSFAPAVRKATVGQQQPLTPYRLPAMKAPRQIHIAIALSLVVLLVETANSLWRIAMDSEARASMTFAAVWIAVALATNALTALLIFHSSRRRNWARIALLLWTLGSWMLWFIYPQRLGDHARWGWLVVGALFIMELAALILLFGGRGGVWYSSRTSATS